MNSFEVNINSLSGPLLTINIDEQNNICDFKFCQTIMRRIYNHFPEGDFFYSIAFNSDILLTTYNHRPIEPILYKEFVNKNFLMTYYVYHLLMNESKKDGMELSMNIDDKNMVMSEGKTKKNKPTNPDLWQQSLDWARQRYEVCPSAYCNGAAAKRYKSKGGKWRKG
jgi:hypothetical protein